MLLGCIIVIVVSSCLLFIFLFFAVFVYALLLCEFGWFGAKCAMW